MSTRPIPRTKPSTCASSVTSTVSRSQPWTTAPCSASAAAIPAPIPCAVPVTTATRPPRSVTRPPVLDQGAHLLDAGLPHPQHVLVRPLVEAAERAVAEQLADLRRVELAHPSDVRHRLALTRELDAREPRPGEVLEPGGVRRVRVDLLDRRPHPRARPP